MPETPNSEIRNPQVEHTTVLLHEAVDLLAPRPGGVYLDGTVGGILASKAWPGLREEVLGLRLILPDGEVVDLGGKVVKNVAGYDVPRLLLGSWGTLGVIVDATLRLSSSAPDLPAVCEPKPFAAGAWQKRVKAAFDPKNLMNPWFHP